MRPTKPINVNGNPNWQYRNSSKTDVAATFARVRREQKDATERHQAATMNVEPIKRRKP